MKWSFSNLAWTAEQDEIMYHRLAEAGFTGLEIAPTRIFPEQPYRKQTEIRSWSQDLFRRFGLRVSSMQSIWYGRTENLFAGAEQRGTLLHYTKEAILFAEAADCPHLVFGCPRNRTMPEGTDSRAAHDFFQALADFAAQHGTVIGMEANPAIYGTNYINTTQEALALVRELHRDSFRLNLDTGTMLANGEPAEFLKGAVPLIHHVHISEPYLKPIQERELHHEILRILSAEGYRGYISVEMGNPGDMAAVTEAIAYIRKLEDAYGVS